MAKYNKKRVNYICSLLSKDSYTIEEICSLSGITVSTYYEWIESKPEFSEAVEKAKETYNQLIVREAKKSLMKKIQGYAVDENKTVFINDKEGKPTIKEKTTIKKHFQPDIVAIIFALTNKAPEEYKNKQSSELTGKDGKDLIPENGLSDLSTEELKQLHNLLKKAGAKK